MNRREFSERYAWQDGEREAAVAALIERTAQNRKVTLQSRANAPPPQQP